MEMYAVAKSAIDKSSGYVSLYTVGVYATRDEARRKMRDEYEKALNILALEDNGACDEHDESIPGGYFADDEAGIYDYVNFAFGQLLEVSSFVINTVDVNIQHGEKPDND